MKKPHTDSVLWTGLLHLASGSVGLIRGGIGLGVSVTGLVLYGTSPEIGLLGVFLLLSLADAIVCGLFGNSVLLRSGIRLLQSTGDALKWGWIYVAVQFAGGLLTLMAALVFWADGFQALGRLTVVYNAPIFRAMCWIHACLTTLAVVWAWVPVVVFLLMVPEAKAKQLTRI